MRQALPIPPVYGRYGRSRQWACANHSEAVRMSGAYSPFEVGGHRKIDHYSLEMYRSQCWLTGSRP